MKKGDEIELTIESLAYGGMGLAKVDGFAVFVRYAIPGERVRAKVLKKKSGYAEAIALERLEASPHYVKPECPHTKYCGGCRFQHLAYDEQLAQKERQVKETLERLGGFKDIEFEPIVPAPDIFYYRNKMEFSFSDKRWLTDDSEHKPKNFALGLHARGNYEKVLDIDDCRLQSEVSNRILDSIRRSATEQKLKPYSVKSQAGYLRYLIVRQAVNTTDLLVNVVTRSDTPLKLGKLVKRLLKDVPEVTSVVNVVNPSSGATAFGDIVNVLHGSGYFKEILVGIELELGAQEFLQTNTKAAEGLYAKALEYANISEGDEVYDLYSGVGSISLLLAKSSERVTGFELLPEATESAARNASANGILNCAFWSGDMKELFRDIADVKKKYGKPDVIVLDPPRSGVHPGIPKRLAALKPKRIVYISCNPATQARDLALLAERGYAPVKAQPFDMFPHTPHIEVVALVEPVG